MPPPHLRRVGLVQHAATQDPRRNLARATELVRDAAGRGAQLVCLPELFRTHYFPQVEDPAAFDLAEPLDGSTAEQLGKLAAELGVVLIAPTFERRAAGLYHNSALILDADGSRVGLYRKMHIPDDPGFYEKFYFAPGDLGFRAVDTAVGRIGVAICWDQWFPETARLLALDGAEMVFFPTAIGWGDADSDTDERDAQVDAWRTVQRAHAIANGIFVAAPNRIGREAAISFWGRSFACDPQGRMLGELDGETEGVLVVDVDLARVEEMRRGWPYLRDRRVDAYADLLERFRS